MYFFPVTLICKSRIQSGEIEKYNFNKDIEICSNNSYYVDSDEDYYDEKCVDLFLETVGII